MTSKRSFTDMMKEDLKRRIWPVALSLIGFFFALPVLALIKLEDHVNSLYQGFDTLVSLQRSFVVYTLGPSNGCAIAGLMIMAVLNALHGMKYLHSRQEADFYGSIPALRSTKFNAAFINGILIAVIPYIIMQLMAAAIGASRGFVTGSGLIFALQTMLLEIIGFLLIYTVIVLAAVLTGHTAVSVAAGAVLSFAFLSYAVLIQGYMSTYFITVYDAISPRTYYLSPFTLFGEMLNYKALNMRGNIQDVTVYGYHLKNVLIAAAIIVLSAVIYVLTLKLISIRPAESAGRAMAFEKTRPFIKIIIMIPVAMTFGAFFPSFTDSKSTYGWLVFGLIVGLILAHAVIEIIYEFDFKACIRHIPSGLIGAIITAAIVSFFVFDFAGYDTRLPDRERFVSAAVYVSGIENSSYSKGYSRYGDDYYEMNDSQICMKDMNLSDVDDVYKLAQAGCDYASKYRWHGYAPDKDSQGDTPGYTSVDVLLRNAFGSEFKRTYYVDTKDPEIFAALGRIYDSDEYKANTYEVLTKDYDAKGSDVNIIRFETAGSTKTADSVTPADADRLLEAMKKETKGLSLDYLRDEAPIGFLEFELKPDKTLADYMYYDTSRPLGYVYPSFTETLGILKELGMDVRGKREPRDVEYMMELRYDDDGNDLSRRIDDRAEIEKLLPDLVNQEYASVNFAVFDAVFDPSYEVHYRPANIREEYEGSNIEYCVMKEK